MHEAKVLFDVEIAPLPFVVIAEILADQKRISGVFPTVANPIILSLCLSIDGTTDLGLIMVKQFLSIPSWYLERLDPNP